MTSTTTKSTTTALQIERSPIMRYITLFSSSSLIFSLRFILLVCFLLLISSRPIVYGYRVGDYVDMNMMIMNPNQHRYYNDIITISRQHKPKFSIYQTIRYPIPLSSLSLSVSDQTRTQTIQESFTIYIEDGIFRLPTLSIYQYYNNTNQRKQLNKLSITFIYSLYGGIHSISYQTIYVDDYPYEEYRLQLQKQQQEDQSLKNKMASSSLPINNTMKDNNGRNNLLQYHNKYRYDNQNNYIFIMEYIWKEEIDYYIPAGYAIMYFIIFFTSLIFLLISCHCCDDLDDNGNIENQLNQQQKKKMAKKKVQYYGGYSPSLNDNSNNNNMYYNNDNTTTTSDSSSMQQQQQQQQQQATYDSYNYYDPNISASSYYQPTTTTTTDIPKYE